MHHIFIVKEPLIFFAMYIYMLYCSNAELQPQALTWLNSMDVRGTVSLTLGSSVQSRSTPTSGPPKVTARAPAHRSYYFRGVKLKSCIKKIHHNLYISKQANVRIKHADTEGASHKKFGTDARVQ